MGLKDLTLSKRQSNINKWISKNSKKAYNDLGPNVQRKVEMGENVFVNRADYYKDTPKGKLRTYLEKLPVGSTIDRTKLREKFKMTSSEGAVSEVIRTFPKKKFKFVDLSKWERPKVKTTEAQRKLSQLLFGEDIYEITSGKRSNIISGKFNKNTMTPYRVKTMYDPIALELGYGKGWNDLTEVEKDRVRTGKPPEALSPQRTLKLNKDLLKLSKDPRIIDIFKNPNRTPAQLKTDVSVVKKILGKETNALSRLTQLAAVFSGKDSRPGISIKFKANAEKIYDALPHSILQRELDESRIGKSVGEKSIKTIKTAIRKNPNYIFTGDYNIDEPAGVASSVRRGTTPYGIFGQIIDKDLNKGDKKSFDANKSIKEAELQKAIQDAKKRKVNIKTDEKVKKALNSFNKLVFNFQKKINIDRPKGTPRIKLFKVTLDSPINSIKNFNTFNPEYKKAFLNNFNTTGYSFQVPRDIKTIPQIAELIQDPSVIKKMTQLVGRFAPRLLALPIAAGVGYAGLSGFSKLVGGTAVSAAEIQRDAQGNVIEPQALERPQITQPQVIEKPETVQYNRETGSFINPITQDKTDQNQLLQWGQENPLTAVAGTSVALSAQEIPRNYKMRRGVGDTGPLPGGKGRIRSSIGIGGALKPVLTTLGTPLVGLGFEGLMAKERLENDESFSDILMDPLGPAASLAFMEPLSRSSGVVRGAPTGIANYFKNYGDLSNVGQARPGLTSKALRLGLSPRMIAGASRFLGLPGLALTTGLAGYNAYKNYQNEEGMIYDFFNKDE